MEQTQILSPLTRRETVWLEAWKASLHYGVDRYGASDVADDCLRNFDKRFPENDTHG